MICYQGKAINFKKSIVCRVALPTSQIINQKTDFLISEQCIDENNQAGFITTSSIETINTNSKPIFQLYENPNSFLLNEGDILLLEPLTGRATKIYDPLSHTNSVFLTETCNSHCIMCPQPPKKCDDFDWINLATRSIPLMKQTTECLGITGGEPTIKWDGLIKTIEVCKTYLPETNIQLLTNARVFKDYVKAKEVTDLAGEQLFISVPIYSDIDLIHDRICGSNRAFWDCIEGLYNLERTGVFIELRIVIIKQNYERLPKMAEFIYRTIPFVGSVAFMALEPIGNAMKNIKNLWIDPIDYVCQIDQAIKILWQRDMNVSLFNHQLCTLPEYLWPLAKKSISEWKIIYMDKCTKCIEKVNCGGFFFSATDYKSRAISPIQS